MVHYLALVAALRWREFDNSAFRNRRIVVGALVGIESSKNLFR
jgi:hypothetical protein